MSKRSLCCFLIVGCLWPLLGQAQIDSSVYNALAPSPVTTSARPMLDTIQLQGATNSLIAYPAQAPSILQNYIGLDVSKIDMTQFDALIARGDYQEI